MSQIGILEDNAQTGEFLQIACELVGHQAQVFTNGFALIDAYKASTTSLHEVLILDYLLPGLTGGETLHNLKQLPNATFLSIIFLTGSGKLMQEQLEEEWKVPILLKPIRLDVFWTTLERVVGRA